MRFNSVQYIVFLSVTVGIYYLLPLKLRKVMLTFASFVFYAAWNAKYLLLMLSVIGVTYLASYLIVKKPENKKIILYTSLAVVLALLFWFKYLNFFISSLNSAFNTEFNALNILLPVGISFYIFQSIGYVIDVYRKEDVFEKSIINYALFISFFPQLVAGPIERSTNMLHQFNTKQKFELENIKNGITLILVGMVQKVVIADRLSVFVTGVFENYSNAGTFTLVLAVIFFAFQVYCDFGAYSLIAIGSARLMGYRLMQNFNRPYLSRSFSEYWSRWHISLSSWFEDYIFLPFVWNNPLKKVNKKFSKPPMRAGLILVFLVSGFWHGASWTYVVWGLIHAAYRVIEATTAKPLKRFYKKNGINQNSAFVVIPQVIITFALNCLTYIFFRADTISTAVRYILRIFTLGKSEILTITEFGMKSGDIILCVVLILLMVAQEIYYEVRGNKNTVEVTIDNLPVLNQSFVYAALFLCLVVFGVYGASYVQNPFIYFQF